MVLGLGGCCSGVAVAAAVSPVAKESGEGAPEVRRQGEVTEAKLKKMASEPVEGAAPVRKKDHQKVPVVAHQFPFHSRPGLL